MNGFLRRVLCCCFPAPTRWVRVRRVYRADGNVQPVRTVVISP